ncbi:MAG: hypothetical protein ACRD1Z_16075, partial [Vicinamibacteria bacterium]
MGRKLALALLLLAAFFALFFALDLEPDFVVPPLSFEVSERARRLHAESIVIDLHADSLLWPRDLSRSGRGGHLDFPRMRKGGLDVAAFTLPTQFFGVAGLKAFHDLWRPLTWFSPWERLAYQLD